MKKLSYILIFIGVLHNTFGQHYIEKSVEATSKNIEIYLNDIDNLILKTTRTNRLNVKLDDSKDGFSNIKIYNENDKLIVRATELILPQEQFNKFCAEQPLLAAYVIVVPINSNVSLKINNGNLSIRRFEGDLKVEIETGEVILNTILGNVSLFIVDGSVQAKLQSAQINVRTNLGKIVSNLPIKDLKQTANTLRGIFKYNTPTLVIKAIKANIYLEAIKD